MLPITIRPERSGDYPAILRLTHEAFLMLDYPGRQRVDEHFLIHLLQDSPFMLPELGFVAELGGRVVGHILYTQCRVLRADGTQLDALNFGPLSVLPEYHRQGIGAALVAHSMAAARAAGHGAVVIMGVPAYYPKLGFGRGREFGLTLEDGTSPDALMAYELVPGYLAGGGRVVFLPPEFVQCETDDAGYWQFHRQYMQKNYPDQLRLRPFWEADVDLLARWLATPHVAAWYKHPEDWLNEARNRRGDFAFLTHFIAEFEGVPIGFCQHYDCFLAQDHETWAPEWQVNAKQGDTFSIDYLIGEPGYLRQGHGTQMIRLLTERVRAHGAKRILVQPEEGNTASQGVLLANGYRLVGGALVKELG